MIRLPLAMTTVLSATLCLGAAQAQTTETQTADTLPALDAEAFDARTQGKTITYSSNGLPYGIEQYLPGRRVRWAFAEGECKEGDWFQSGEQICFDYRDESGLQCWTFHDTDQGLMAHFMGDRSDAPLISLQESPEPLDCPGPDIGV